MPLHQSGHLRINSRTSLRFVEEEEIGLGIFE